MPNFDAIKNCQVCSLLLTAAAMVAFRIQAEPFHCMGLNSLRLVILASHFKFWSAPAHLVLPTPFLGMSQPSDAWNQSRIAYADFIKPSSNLKD